MKKAFHLMAKPSSYHCNLACEYCFYLPKGKSLFRQQPPLRHMSPPVLEQFIRRYIQSSPTDDVNFSWQGGEPTLAGLEFYQQVVKWQQHYANGKRITNSIQTNGVLLSDNWVQFLAQQRFLVGVSVDGPRQFYDAFRKSPSGGSVFDKVVEGVARLHRYQVDFNLLAVVNQYTAAYPQQIYPFLTKELGAQFVQFIPVVELLTCSPLPAEQLPTGACKGEVTPWSVSAQAYGDFLISVFDQWVRHDVGRVFVQLFDNTLAAWTGQTPDLCVMRPQCGAALVIEQNGDIYSCDHFVTPQHRLGNILTDDPLRLANSKQQRQFSGQKTPNSASCQRCEYRFVCQGGCPKHRIVAQGRHWQNALCQGYQAFFRHVAPYMDYMAQQIALRRPPANVMPLAQTIATQQSLSSQ